MTNFVMYFTIKKNIFKWATFILNGEIHYRVLIAKHSEPSKFLQPCVFINVRKQASFCTEHWTCNYCSVFTDFGCWFFGQPLTVSCNTWLPDFYQIFKTGETFYMGKEGYFLNISASFWYYTIWRKQNT